MLACLMSNGEGAFKKQNPSNGEVGKAGVYSSIRVQRPQLCNTQLVTLDGKRGCNTIVQCAGWVARVADLGMSTGAEAGASVV